MYIYCFNYRLIIYHKVINLFNYRQLGEYGDFVQSKSAPEGCIAEAYIAHECVTYAKMYLGASNESIPEEPMLFNLSILSRDVEVSGRMPASYNLTDDQLAIAHWFVLINCPEVEFWKNIHLNCADVGGDVNYHNSTFANYFCNWVRNFHLITFKNTSIKPLYKIFQNLTLL